MDPAVDGPAIRGRLGVCPQEDTLDNELNVFDNLYIYGRYFGIDRATCRERAGELLEFAQITDKAKAKVEDLSGGMKRRLTIARSLINNPDVLLLDEPTTGLDPQARHVLWDQLFRLKQAGVTLVITTHYMDEAEQLCDRLVVMDKGLIAAEGSPRELIEAHSTREVAELRFGVGEHEAARREDRGPRRPGRGAARPAARLQRPRRAGRRRRRRARPAPHRDAGAPLHPRGRVPAPHRPKPGRLMAATEARPGARPAGSLSVREGMTRQYDYWLTVYKRTWRGGVVSSFATPLFYVVAMGVLLGGFIDADPDRLEGATTYLAFIVPGLVAAHAMTIAVSETTYPVMGAIKWHKTFFAQLATPLAVRDLVNAFLGFVVFRVASACAVFMLVLAPFGVFESWWGPILAWVSQVLVGTAFATLTFGYSTRLKSEEGFGLLFRLGVLPLTLFSGRLLPDLQPRARARVGGPAHAAVARRLAVADAVPRHRRLAARRAQRRRARRALRRRVALGRDRSRQAAGGVRWPPCPRP